MTLQEAIVARHSVRQYLEKPIESEKVAQLQALIDECNKARPIRKRAMLPSTSASPSAISRLGQERKTLAGRKGHFLFLFN